MIYFGRGNFAYIRFSFDPLIQSCAVTYIIFKFYEFMNFLVISTLLYLIPHFGGGRHLPSFSNLIIQYFVIMADPVINQPIYLPRSLCTTIHKP